MLANTKMFIVDCHYPGRPGDDPAAGRKLEYRRSPGYVRIPRIKKEFTPDERTTDSTQRLLVRFIAGPLCDRFGPRLVFVALLLCGSIPTAMAGLVTNPQGLIALRFFVGILGGTFVPCQVWCTGFFDKKIVGTANSLSGGWGNAGGGIT